MGEPRATAASSGLGISEVSVESSPEVVGVVSSVIRC